MMKKINECRDRLNWFKLMFILIAIHSFVIGSGLIICPVKFLLFFNFNVPVEKFFPMQSGIFHYVMTFAYIMIVLSPARNKGLILLSIVTKLMATIFLFSYYFLAEKSWAILLCGIVDCIIGLTIVWCYLNFYWDLDNTEFDFSDSKYHF